MTEVPDSLYVAAGGGGDVLGAAMVAATRGIPLEKLHVATFAWERKRYDPSLGPRGAANFYGLEAPAPGVWQFSSRTRLRRGRSFLPSLVHAVGCNVYLLDPHAGTHGLRRQLDALVRHLASPGITLVDVGGDILARGKEPGLRSPTADAMALAATVATGHCRAALAVGLGLDGELTDSEWRSACRNARNAGARLERPQRLDAAVARALQPSFDWHPSEVAGLACLAALGLTGAAEVRSDGLRVQVRRSSAEVHSFDPAWLMRRNTVAQALANTRSLNEILLAVREVTGRSELEDERRMLDRARAHRTTFLTPVEIEQAEQSLLDYSRDVSRRGVGYLTLRRVGEMLRLSPRPFGQFRGHLARRYPDRVRAPVWRTSLDSPAHWPES
jgi:hypothetical protein